MTRRLTRNWAWTQVPVMRKSRPHGDGLLLPGTPTATRRKTRPPGCSSSTRPTSISANCVMETTTTNWIPRMPKVRSRLLTPGLTGNIPRQRKRHIFTLCASHWRTQSLGAPAQFVANLHMVATHVLAMAIVCWQKFAPIAAVAGLCARQHYSVGYGTMRHAPTVAVTGDSAHHAKHAKAVANAQ